MGWQGCPVVVKVGGAGSKALPGAGAVGWVHSVGKVGRRASGVKGVTGGVMVIGQQGKGSHWEGPGRAWAVANMVGSSGRASWWVARQNSL